MSSTGTRFIRGSQPRKLERAEANVAADGTPQPGGIRVTWQSAAGQEEHEVFDTVVFATGRAPVTAGLGLPKVGVLLDLGGKIVGGGPLATLKDATAAERLGERSPWSETSTVPSIHAIGDVLAGRPELTPVAIRAGKLLAMRLMSGELDDVPPSQPATSRQSAALRTSMDYTAVATTVFTPIEYACVGLSEEQACAAYGAEGVDAYHSAYDTLELAVAHRADPVGLPLPPQCYSKVIVTRGTSPSDERVLGIHVLGPNAGEVIQGYAVAVKMGATRADLLETVAIHPTHSEEILNLEHTKRSGESFVKTSC